MPFVIFSVLPLLLCRDLPNSSVVEGHTAQPSEEAAQPPEETAQPSEEPSTPAEQQVVKSEGSEFQGEEEQKENLPPTVSTEETLKMEEGRNGF